MAYVPIDLSVDMNDADAVRRWQDNQMDNQMKYNWGQPTDPGFIPVSYDVVPTANGGVTTTPTRTSTSGSRTSGSTSGSQYDVYAAQERKRIEALEAQRKATLETTYQNSRSVIAGQSAAGARNLAEYLAARGLTNSGAAVQGEINRMGALQGNLTALEQDRNDALYGIQTERETALAQMQREVLARQEAAEAQRKAEETAAFERARQTEMDTMGRYYGDIAARINELKANGDPYGMIPYYELMRAEKLQALAEQEAAATATRSGGTRSANPPKPTEYKPLLTAAQARDALNNGIKTQSVIDAYNYWYGTNHTLQSVSGNKYVSDEAFQSLSKMTSPVDAEIFKAVVDGEITVQEANLLRFYNQYGR